MQFLQEVLGNFCSASATANLPGPISPTKEFSKPIIFVVLYIFLLFFFYCTINCAIIQQLFAADLSVPSWLWILLLMYQSPLHLLNCLHSCKLGWCYFLASSSPGWSSATAALCQKCKLQSKSRDILLGWKKGGLI